MLAHLEPGAAQRPGFSRILADFGPTYFANGLIGFIFSATGPVAIVLSVGTGGGLSQEQIASWVFGMFFFNALITIAMSWRYHMPLGFAWTIPGTVLVGPALGHLSFPEVVGAFYATSALVLLLGFSGWVKRLMSALPMPIVMGMVAGVFLRFGLDLVRALQSDVAIAAPMILTFVVLSTQPGLAKKLPPLIGSLIVGAAAIALLGRGEGAALGQLALGQLALAQPVFTPPQWSVGALVELVIPLAITVLVVQNGQGVAVLRAAKHEPPVNAIAVACGIGSVLCAAVGAVSTCLTGPTNALMTSSGERSRHYTAALTFGGFGLLFGLMAPIFTGLMLSAPKAYIMVLGGLAMLRVLQGSFVASFGGGRFTLGALISLIVTISDVSILNIGAAFWGLVAGFVFSWLLEKHDFVALANADR